LTEVKGDTDNEVLNKIAKEQEQDDSNTPQQQESDILEKVEIDA
jgi:hypothetical protein